MLFDTVTDELVTVCGGGFYTYALPSSASARPNAGLVGSGISPERRAANALLKQRLMEKRWIRHKDIPEHLWHQDNVGFYHLPYPIRYRQPLLSDVAL